MTDLLFEAIGQAGDGRFRVRAIQAGLSGNGNFYSDALLRGAVPLFEGVPVFVKADREHLTGGGMDFRNLIGQLVNAKFTPGATPDTGAIEGELTVVDGAIAGKLAEAVKRGMQGLFGLSIDAVGSVKPGQIGGKPAKIATALTKVKSVDLIIEPGAGGRVINLIEARREANMDEPTLSDSTIDLALRGSGLPASSQRAIKKKLAGRTDVTQTELHEALAARREVVAELTESGHVRLGDFPRIEVIEDRAAKMANMMDAFFDPQHQDHRHAWSIRECYRAITGDKFVTGRLADCDDSMLRDLMPAAPFRESLISSTWSNVLGNSITRRMIAMYRRPDYYSLYRKIASLTSVADFRTNERTRFGGYGDLPGVNEGAAYLPLASPTDEKATYAATKRGGTEDITLEMIKNDDVRAVQMIPVKLAMSAKRTLSKFCFDFILNNPVIYDGIVWFHATHNNLVATALDAANFAAARLLMMKQTEANSADRLGIPPKNLVVPLDLQEGAYNIFQRATENDKKFVATLLVDIIPVWYWTDTTDWAIMADPDELPTIEIGFLDGNEEPELFVQDNPTVGSMFSNDKLTYKIRHVYGGNVVDFRGGVKSVQ